MKNKSLYYCYLFSFLMTFIIHSASADIHQKEKPIKVTQEFYTQYMKLYFQMAPTASPEYKILMRDHISPDFLEIIKSAKICVKGNDPVCGIDGVEPWLSYVYIIRAQDAYEDWTHVSVEPQKLSTEYSVMKVSLGGINEEAHILSVKLIKIDGKWKINSVSDLKPAKYRYQ